MLRIHSMILKKPKIYHSQQAVLPNDFQMHLKPKLMLLFQKQVQKLLSTRQSLMKQIKPCKMPIPICKNQMRRSISLTLKPVLPIRKLKHWKDTIQIFKNLVSKLLVYKTNLMVLVSHLIQYKEPLTRHKHSWQIRARVQRIS